jgi:hypothetical protein
MPLLNLHLQPNLLVMPHLLSPQVMPLLNLHLQPNLPELLSPQVMPLLPKPPELDQHQLMEVSLKELWMQLAMPQKMQGSKTGWKIMLMQDLDLK